ncbi:MAG: Gfo/Idh/MocA family oxidoreductase [bacterium]|nr:MAG: Gfo/Idh/MocA family oxidoreductase [bacterium]
MQDKVKYGIIGFGTYAEKRLLPAFLKSRHSVLTAITKRNIDQAKNLAQRYRISGYFDDVPRMLEQGDVDAVIVTSPPGFHMEHALISASYGKHVMVEKPFASDQSQALKMVNACREKNVKCMAAFVMRFIDAIQKTRAWIHAGKVGTVDFAGGYFGLDVTFSSREWLLDPALSGGGVVADLGSHFLDLLQYVLDQKIIRTQVIMTPSFSPRAVERKAIIELEFENQILGSIYLSFNVIRESGLTFHGSQGKLSLKNFNRPEVTVNLDYYNSAGDLVIDVPNGNYYARMIDHFSESILYDTPLLTPGEVGLENQKIIDTIYGKK